MTAPQRNLGRWTFFAAVAIVVATSIPAYFDVGRYRFEFNENGLLGFLKLPSALTFQIVFLFAGGALLMKARSIGQRLGFSISILLYGIALGVYGFSIFLLHTASRIGEFGAGLAGVAGLLFFPSAGVLLFGVPSTIIAVIINSSDLVNHDSARVEK